MLVKDVMVKEIRTAHAEDLVRSVAAVMCTNALSGLPVVDFESNLIGFISEKDILHALLPKFSDFLEDPLRARDFVAMEETYLDVLSKQVKDLMTPKPYTVQSEDPILKAASYMSLHRFRRVPVVEEGKLVGIITLADIHKAIFRRELNIS